MNWVSGLATIFPSPMTTDSRKDNSPISIEKTAHRNGLGYIDALRTTRSTFTVVNYRLNERNFGPFPLQFSNEPPALIWNLSLPAWPQI